MEVEKYKMIFIVGGSCLPVLLSKRVFSRLSSWITCPDLRVSRLRIQVFCKVLLCFLWDSGLLP